MRQQAEAAEQQQQQQQYYLQLQYQAAQLQASQQTPLVPQNISIPTKTFFDLVQGCARLYNPKKV
jgi:hypothetical protein